MTGNADQNFLARGRLMSAEMIAVEFFGDKKRSRWVRKSVAPKRRMRLGHSTVRWYERDVLEWLDGQRGRING